MHTKSDERQADGVWGFGRACLDVLDGGMTSEGNKVYCSQ